MPRDLSSAVSTKIALQQKQPSLLFEVEISSTTLYYTNDRRTIVFDNKTYTPKAIIVTDVQHSVEGSLSQITLQFDNVSRDMSSFVNSGIIENKNIIIKRIYHGTNFASGTTDYVEVFHGSMESPDEISRYWVTIKANDGKPLYRKALLQQYQKQCRYSFGNDYCNADNKVDLNSPSTMYCEGNPTSGGTNYIIFNKTSGSTVGRVDDAFNFGQILLGLNGVTYTRSISDYTSATSRIDWVIGTPDTITTSHRYKAIKGCSMILSSCTAAYAYGPVSDNGDNFGGFLHIGENRGRVQAL